MKRASSMTLQGWRYPTERGSGTRKTTREGRPSGTWEIRCEMKVGRGQGLEHIGLVAKVRNLDFYSISSEKPLVNFKQEKWTNMIFCLSGRFDCSEDKGVNWGKRWCRDPSWKHVQSLSERWWLESELSLHHHQFISSMAQEMNWEVRCGIQTDTMHPCIACGRQRKKKNERHQRRLQSASLEQVGRQRCHLLSSRCIPFFVP